MISRWFNGDAKSDPPLVRQSNSLQETHSSNGHRRVTTSRQDVLDSLRSELLKISSQASATRTQAVSDMTVAPAEPLAGCNTGQGLSLEVAKLQDDWQCDYNQLYVNSGVPLPSQYTQLQVDGRPDVSSVIVKVVKRPDAWPGCVHIAHAPRINLRLNKSTANKVTLMPCKSPPARCWDSVSLVITSVLRSDTRSYETRQTTKSEFDLGRAFLKQFHASGCVLVDNHAYVFDDGAHIYTARARLESSERTQEGGGLLTKNATVANIELSRGAARVLQFSGALIPAVDVQKLSARFEFNGERYGIGGLEKHIQRFVNEFVAPRLLSGALREKVHSSISRGGILSGPPGTGKTLFISVLGSLLRDNGFAVREKTVSGPEVFDSFMGKSEANVREIFAGAGDDPKTIHLILIDEIDSMLPRRGGVSDSTGAGSKVVNQFLTCLDGIRKKNNLVVFGTTNRPDLIDPAVMRPGRMNMKMQFNLPDEAQRRQILQIHAKDLSECGMLQPDVNLDQLAAQTTGFTGAELAAVIDSARVSALRRAQGLGEDDMYFSPQGISNLETFDLNADDFRFALKQIQPQFGKSDFMPLAGKSYESGGYPVSTISTLQATLKRFKQNPDSSVFRILIQGPPGSGKSTLAALAQRDFGSFCSYVSAVDVVTSRDRSRPLVDAFSQARQQSGRHTVVIDDFDTMINFDGLHYDRGLVSTLDAYTKQSLRGAQENKQLVLVTATEHQDCCGSVQFLPMLFPQDVVFRTRLDAL